MRKSKRNEARHGTRSERPLSNGPRTDVWPFLELIDDAVIAVSADGIIRRANGVAVELFGHDRADLLGAPLDLLIPESNRSAHHSHFSDFASSGGEHRRMTERLGVNGLKADGIVFPADISISRVDIDGDALMVALVRDTSHLLRMTDQIGWLSTHDRVTGLPRRDTVTAAMDTHRESPEFQGGAVFAMDIDGFGFVNDAYGARVGDLVLRTIAQRLAGLAGPAGGSAGRLGNDEFVVYVPAAPDAPSLELWAQRLSCIVERPIVVDEVEIALHLAVGGRILSVIDDGSDDVVSDAITALNDAKSRHVRHLVAYTDAIRDRAGERLRVLSELTDAIPRGELWLAYQPIVDSSTGVPRSAEALLRWNHPTLGEVSPALFIPIAEESDVIDRIGRWTLGRACAQIAEWEGADWMTEGFRVAVNVSARQLRNQNVVDDVRSAIGFSEISPSRLRIEVTETLAMEDVAVGIDVLRAISALGVSIGLDDFGTGFSSLAQLGRLPIDEIKIDRSFVARLDTDPAAVAIVGAVMAIANVFGKEVVAEGVERLDQLSALVGMGCQLIQGWYFAPAEDPVSFVQTVLRLRSDSMARSPQMADTSEVSPNR